MNLTLLSTYYLQVLLTFSPVEILMFRLIRMIKVKGPLYLSTNGNPPLKTLRYTHNFSIYLREIARMWSKSN